MDFKLHIPTYLHLLLTYSNTMEKNDKKIRLYDILMKYGRKHLS